jgi:hypothetical protein
MAVSPVNQSVAVLRSMLKRELKPRSCEEIAGRRYSPPCITAAKRKRLAARSPKKRRGGCVIKKISRSPRSASAIARSLKRSRRSRGGFPFVLIGTPPRPRETADASRYFLDRSATPPRGYARRGIRLIPICSRIPRDYILVCYGFHNRSKGVRK